MIDLPLEASKSSLGPRWLASIDPPKFIPVARSAHNSTMCVMFLRLLTSALTVN